VVNRILSHRRKKGRVLTLALNSQDHYYIRTVECVFHSFLNSKSRFNQLWELEWNECAGTCHADSCSQGGKQVDVRPCNSRMQYVANNGDFQTVDCSLVLPDRQCIEQRLGRMFVSAVTCVDNRRIAHPGEVFRRPGHRVAYHNTVRRHRLEISGGVQECFSFR